MFPEIHHYLCNTLKTIPFYANILKTITICA